MCPDDRKRNMLNVDIARQGKHVNHVIQFQRHKKSLASASQMLNHVRKKGINPMTL